MIQNWQRSRWCFCSFIDKCITADIPPVATENEHHIKPTGNLHKHTHSDYCHWNKSWHFGFLNAPGMKPLISWPPIDDHDKIMQNHSYTLCKTHLQQQMYISLHNIPARNLIRCWDIYGWIEDFTKRSKCYFEAKPKMLL